MSEASNPYTDLFNNAWYETENERKLNAARVRQEIDEQTSHGYLYDAFAGVSDGVAGFVDSATKLVSDATGLEDNRAFHAREETRSFAGDITRNLTQFFVGFTPASAAAGALGKAMNAGKWGNKLLKAGAGFATDFTAFDGENRLLGGILADHPKLQAPILSYLASDPNDGWAQKRFKNGLEGLGLGVVADFALKSLRAWKLSKAGGEAAEAAHKEAADSLEALAAKRPEFFETTGDTVTPAAKLNTAPQLAPHDAQAMRDAGLKPSELPTSTAKVEEAFPGRGVDMPAVPDTAPIVTGERNTLGGTFNGDLPIHPPEFPRPGDILESKPATEFRNYADTVEAYDAMRAKASVLPKRTIPEFETTIKPDTSLYFDAGGQAQKVVVKSVEAGHVVVENEAGQVFSVLESELSHSPRSIEAPSSAPISVPRDASVPMC